MSELIGYGISFVVPGTGLGWWIHHDGPARLLAGLIATAHSDEIRRRDARRVLTATKYLRRRERRRR
ncbi:hypothetical protein [Nocardia cyriacigeorgica]|uniref:hypothetical protein n=1 Tax=Nocardia cyriacigeorgica TaxID=135487 RepID=UPI002457FF36|nr:hypothetical protein [Nocardia cyriacigeorgica]